jgi:hypothetical protein
MQIEVGKGQKAMRDSIEWEVQLPIIGIEIYGEEINFGLFSIKKSKRENLKDKYNLAVRDSMWSPLVLAVKITGAPVALEDLCEYCPRRSTPHTRPVNVNGRVMEVTSLQRKACICLKLEKYKNTTDSIEVARHLLEDVLSLIRLFIHISSKGSFPAHAAISLDRLPHYSDVVALGNNGVAYSESLVPSTRKYDVPIKQNEVDSWIATLGFDHLASIIYRSHTGESVTDIEDILGASFIQFGSMLEEANLRDCFLRGATALEAITNAAPGPAGVSLKFREIGATLAMIASDPKIVSSPTPNADAQMKASWADDRDKLKFIYKDRCHISHGSRRLNEINEDSLFIHQIFFARIAFGALLLFIGTHKSRQHFYSKLLTLNNALSK